MNLEISDSVKHKLLEKHSVTVVEVVEAFANRQMKFRKETRAEHVTVPTTCWFIAETDSGRILKIAFIPGKVGKKARLKTAFPIDE